MKNEQPDSFYNIWSEELKKYLKGTDEYIYFKLFMSQFEKRYSNTIKNYGLNDLCQLSGGNRLRPTMIMAIYLYNKPLMLKTIKINDISKLIDICISMELIHKASLILDDMIDDDETRKGVTTFHAKYGDKYAGMLSVTLVTDAINRLNVVFHSLKISEDIIKKSVSVSTSMTYSMAIGALKELQLDNMDIFEMDTIEKIVHGEVSSLFTSSLLLGYYCGGGQAKDIEDLLIELGDTCGFFFQLLNDLEPYLSAKKNANHKTIINYDIQDNKTNLVIAYLGEFMSKKEKREYGQITKKNIKIDYIQNKLEKYNVIEFSLKQKELIKSKFNRIFEKFNECGASDSWIELISNALKVFIMAGEKRLK